MKRFVVILNKDNSISCIPIGQGGYKELELKYKIIIKVNKLWNPHYVAICKNYFQKRGNYNE